MKKFKFFALTALFCAMGLNAFAAPAENRATIGVYKVAYDPASAVAPELPAATIIGFKNDVTAAEIESLTIPATMTDITNGNIEVKITSIDFQYDATTMAENATAIPLVKSIDMTGATNLTTLVDYAFQGFTGLTSIAFGAELEQIGGWAFDKTAVATIDLSGTKVTEIYPLVATLNDKITTVLLPANLTIIHDNAFSNLTTLTTINWSACTKSIIVGDGGAGVFDHCLTYKTAEWSAKVKQISTDALAGSSIESLTLNSYVNITDPVTTHFPEINATGETTVKTLIVNGDFGGHIYGGAFTSLETLTFQGKIAYDSDAGEAAIAEGAFVCPNLATINFNGELDNNVVAAGAFQGASTELFPDLIDDETEPVLTINYPNATATSPAMPFANAAFGTDAATWNFATLVTSDAFKEVLVAAYGHSNVPAATIYAVFIVTQDIAPEKDLLAVATKEGSSFYYAKLLTTDAQLYKIAKKQVADNHMVVVYSAYVDESDGTIYMNNLRIRDGYYHVPAYEPVIVKSATAADVELELWNDGGVDGIQGDNEIEYIDGDDITGLDLKTSATFIGAGTAEKPDYIPYFLAPIADYGFLWSKIADGRILKAVGLGNFTGDYYNKATKETTGDFYMKVKNVPVAAAARVVWLDGSEDNSTTGIDFVEASENTKSGVIYNLAGQKVNNDYKGVIIVNGQKKIQK